MSIAENRLLECYFTAIVCGYVVMLFFCIEMYAVNRLLECYFTAIVCGNIVMLFSALECTSFTENRLLDC